MFRKMRFFSTNEIFEEPILGELFSPSRMEKFAYYLASELKVSFEKRRGNSLRPGVRKNHKQLQVFYKKLINLISSDKLISPSGEWIVDNFHIIEDQIREINVDLPEKYYQGLPKISEGELSGYPRVYAIALALVAHTGSQLEISTIKKFVSAYQSVTPLLIGEIWAIPIVIRIALIENLTRLAHQEVISQSIKEKIDLLSEQLMEKDEIGEENIQGFIKKISRILGKSHSRDCSAVSQIARRLHTRKPELLLACEKVDEYLANNGLVLEEVIRTEQQYQATNHLTISNSITSMRLLSSTDWESFFESLSLVDKVLAQDPSGAYKKMDFSSRDRYRHVIEQIHKKTNYGEQEIAQESVKMAQQAKNHKDKKSSDIRKHHVGYYLTTKGVRRLEKRIGYRPTIKEIIKRKILENPNKFYFGLLALVTLLLLTPIYFYLKMLGTSYWWLLTVTFIAIFPTSDTSLNIINLIVTFFLGPHILPKLKIENGLPDDAKTFVVVPTIIDQIEVIPRILENLEIRFLANQEENLYFALLSDFADASSKQTDSDEIILGQLERGIISLNKKYSGKTPIFYLFNRERLWNASEQVWMGWERKRGKIHEFNKFLRGNEETSFNHHPPFTKLFQEIQYVITLDSDTKLPRGAAKKLVGTILHPLNRPQFDSKSGLVKKGYGILQPRISITPESSLRSIFSSIYSDFTGIDPYSTAVSDVYQDLYAEGIYTGKGLYVVDAFEKALKNRSPENTLLSHDLFEGVFARTALVSDIELLDDYPSHFISYSKRLHRWIRGDWQIIKWIFSSIPDAKDGKSPTPLSLISRWKIFDNLRRSLMAPSVFLWLICGWSLLPGHPLAWTALILTVLIFPIYTHMASNLIKYPLDLPLHIHLKGIANDLKINLSQFLIVLTTLPYQTFQNVDAIATTLYRVFISKKNLLEWTTAAKTESLLGADNSFKSKIFRTSSLISLIIGASLAFQAPSRLFVALPILSLWFFAPDILEKISAIKLKKTTEISPEDQNILRSITCRTWNFFETFVTKEDNWLPPDNFQEEPEPLIAHRTSPTNMGLYLLASCSAYDFGYIGPIELVERLEQTLASMGKLERRYGHFYNWYDTSDLTPLDPQYISTVDSGNLAGHLLAVKQTCLELKEGPIQYNLSHYALKDLFEIIREISLSIDKKYFKTQSENNSSFIILMEEISDLIKNLDENDFDDRNMIYDVLIEQVRKMESKIATLSQFHGDSHYQTLIEWIVKLGKKIEGSKSESLKLSTPATAEIVSAKFKSISKTCHNMAMEMDFSMLYDKRRKLFSIGFNIGDGQRDERHYDLLASEARLASFISIAKGDAPDQHWFHLGRQMTSLFRKQALISWSASMFEYLMPLLIMRNYFGSLLSKTHQSIIQQQIAYALPKKLPWGISESGYNARDLHMNYQYGPFGVPGLGLKRGLSHDFVVSPYSTALAAQVLPEESIENFKTLISINLLTKYGFYEAVDYTKDRIPPNENSVVIKNFMAHHQGMTLISLGNVIHKNKFPKRFHQDPLTKSSELLLQERLPKRISIFHPREEEVFYKNSYINLPTSVIENLKNVNTNIPQVRVLSNGEYTLMLNASGSGFSQCNGLSVYKWTEDPCLDLDGQYLFVRDELDDSLWSPTFLPFAEDQDNYETTFSEHKVDFHCKRKTITSHVESLISAGDNVELKRITLVNLTENRRRMELTSYGEPVLAKPESYQAHPVFSKLFLELEHVREKSALVAHRRKRAEDDADIYAFHLIASSKKKISQIQFETSRSQFIGRGNTLRNAKALAPNIELSNKTEGTLDPIFSIRAKFVLEPFETASFTYASGITDSKENALRLIDQYHDIHAFDREEKMAWTQNQISLKHLELSAEKIKIFQKLVSGLLYSLPSARPGTNFIQSNKKAQSTLWSYGISGDLPILLVSIKNKHDLQFISEVLQFHEYFRGKKIEIDLVIMSEETNSYHMAIHEDLLYQVRIAGGQRQLNERAGIFLLRKNLIPEEDNILFLAAARIHFDSHHGNLKTQVNRLFRPKKNIPNMQVVETFKKSWESTPIPAPYLKYFNGYGGFSDSGSEYVILNNYNKAKPPAPWSNVISNSKGFGFLVTEKGSSCSWSQNSHENRMTPWSNDPVIDPSGEITYIYDRQSKKVWSLEDSSISSIATHGQGYSTFESVHEGIIQKLTMYVSLEEEVKFIRLKIKNQCPETRNLSIFYFLELVLGSFRNKTSHHIKTGQHLTSDFFWAQNPFNPDFGNRITFVASNKKESSFTCDRQEFLGRHGSYVTPISVNRKNLNGRIGVSLDPCFALKLDLNLGANEEDEVIFILGQSSEMEHINQLVASNANTQKADQVFEEVKNFWDKNLGTIQIKTDYPHFDFLINRWTLYQTLSCRIWGRTAFYQSGGAYGFRDQLQDVTSLVYSNPEIAREHILRSAAHQFIEGDVLHWWHPPLEKGVRTRFSDDLLWLPFVVNFYIETTGDTEILKEKIEFVEGPALQPLQDDLYIQTVKSPEKKSLYEHCILAIDHGLKFGAHGLPLMGSGDWNDGMNTVGNKGHGESIWLAWFLGDNLKSFIPICKFQEDEAKSVEYKLHLDNLTKAISKEGWDGQWYKRAYFDDGTPLGSSTNDECKIDSIAQSWSVLSGLGEKEKSSQALLSSKKYLLNKKDKLTLLFSPPFDKTTLKPGYIKGYLPGIRENGGQYTHAAIWLAMAFAKIEDRESPFEIMSMLNPVQHTLKVKDVEVYELEPYVIPADIYANPFHMGKGGWSWYTGSSAWFYRCFLESILGFRLKGQHLHFSPCLPKGFDKFELDYRTGSYNYKIKLIKQKDKKSIFLDDKYLGTELIVPLLKDGAYHEVIINYPS